MAKAGLIEEMMNDALDSALDTEDMEEETEGEIEKVLMEVAGETLAALPAAKARPVSVEQGVQSQPFARAWQLDTALATSSISAY